MKIKNKLTLIFILLITIILVLLNVYIYLLSRTSTINNFYNQLKDRAIITATVFLEADEQSSTIINAFQKKYLHALPGEIIRVYNENNEKVYVDSTDAFSFDPKIVNEVRQKREFRQESGTRQMLGIYYEDNQGNFVIIASAIDEAGISNLDQLKKVLLAGFLSSLIVVFFAGRYFTKLMLKPVSLITHQANRISETNLHLRLNEGNKKDELAELSVTINKMLKRLENAFELQKEFVANASHELRTPLTSIIGNIEVTLTKARTVEEHKIVLASIMEEADKLHRLTNGLLNLAQSNLDFSLLNKEEIRLDELMIDLKAEMKVKRSGSEVEIMFPEMPENPDALTISGDKNLMETALLNILDNAFKFSNNQKVLVALRYNRHEIIITVTDTGIGIEPAELSHITETFYRADNAHAFAGSGIGLALVEKIIKLHKGELLFTSILGKGTIVTVKFSKK